MLQANCMLTRAMHFGSVLNELNLLILTYFKMNVMSCFRNYFTNIPVQFLLFLLLQTFNPSVGNSIRNVGSHSDTEECDIRSVWRRSAGIEKRVSCHPTLKYLPMMPDIAPKPILKKKTKNIRQYCWFCVNVDGCINDTMHFFIYWCLNASRVIQSRIDIDSRKN